MVDWYAYPGGQISTDPEVVSDQMRGTMRPDKQLPKLLLYPANAPEFKQLVTSPVIGQFNVTEVGEDAAWVDQLSSGAFQLAIVHIDRSSDKQLQQCMDGQLVSDIEFIFTSDGKPNPLLDRLMLDGAGYHFREPFELAAIEDCLQDIAEDFEESAATANIKTSDLDQFGLLAGSSRVMRKLYRTIRKVAKTDVNVLITGESGSGKELVANTVHLFSDFRDGPFIAINCGAISPELVDSELFGHVKGAFTGAIKDHMGVFEQAEGGTLFLDEVTEMPLEQQVKLLRVLETGEYRPVGAARFRRANVRVIAATNRVPLEAVEQGLFREDLYYRLAQFPVEVPPLRQRGADITGLAKHFLAYRNASEQSNKQITNDALGRIASYSWPGNVRELKHTIERAFILCENVIEQEHIVLENLDASEDKLVEVPTGVPLEEIEKQAIVQTLEENDGNKTETAEQLGVSVKTLYNKLEKYQSK